MQMVKGLNGEPSSLPMLPSFAVTLPTGGETGQYYALDLGGTNFRMLRVQLSDASSPPVVDIRQVAIPAPAMQGTAEALFAFIASNLVRAVRVRHTSKTYPPPCRYPRPFLC